MIAASVELKLSGGDDICLTHFHRDRGGPDSVVLGVMDGDRSAMAELTMAELAALRDALGRMCDRGGKGGVPTG